MRGQDGVGRIRGGECSSETGSGRRMLSRRDPDTLLSEVGHGRFARVSSSVLVRRRSNSEEEEAMVGQENNRMIILMQDHCGGLIDLLR